MTYRTVRHPHNGPARQGQEGAARLTDHTEQHPTDPASKDQKDAARLTDHTKQHPTDPASKGREGMARRVRP